MSRKVIPLSLMAILCSSPYGQAAPALSVGRLAPHQDKAPQAAREQSQSSLFSISLNPQSEILRTKFRQPFDHSDAIEIVSLRAEANPDIALRGFVKKAPQRSNMLWLDLYIENKTKRDLIDVELELKNIKGTRFFPAGEQRVYDFTIDPFTTTPLGSQPILLERIAAEGMSRVALGIPHGLTADVTMDAEVRSMAAQPTRSTRSSTLALAENAGELWSTFADGDVVAVVDTETETRVDQIPFAKGARPNSIALTPDEKWVLIALAESNEILLIDRETRSIVQRWGEDIHRSRDLRHIVVTPNGEHAFASGYVTDTIVVLKKTENGFAYEKTIATDRRPDALTVLPDSSHLLVAHFLPRGPIVDNESWATQIDISSLQVKKEILFADQFNLDRAACVKIPYLNPFLRLKIGEVTDEDVALESIFTQMAGIFLNPNGTEAWIPGTRVSGGVQVWEFGPKANPEVGNLVTFRPGELSIPIILMMDARQGTLTHQLLDGFERDVPKEYSKCLGLEREFDFTRGDFRRTAPNELVNRVATFPTGITGLSEIGAIRNIVYTRGGRRALLLSYTSDEIAVQDAITGHPASVSHFMLSGSNPDGMVLNADGSRAYVSYENSPFVSVLDLSVYSNPDALPEPTYVPYEYKHVKDVPFIIGVTGGRRENWLTRHVENVPQKPMIQELAQIPLLDEDPMDPVLRKGKILFTSANPEKWKVSGNRLGACESCHPGGGHDGSAWATVEGERRTASLYGGVAGRGWLHASGTHNNALEFVELVSKERLGGSLDHKDAQALAKYVAFGIPRIQSPIVDAAAAARGQALFEQSCTGCHFGQHHTSGNPDPNDVWGGGGANDPILIDFGTASDNSFVVLGTVFERLFPNPSAQLLQTIRGDRALGDSDFAQEVLDYTPRPNRPKGVFKATPLTGVYDYSVFYHHGKLASLEEAVEDTLAKSSLSLSEQEKQDLLTYLKTL